MCSFSLLHYPAFGLSSNGCSEGRLASFLESELCDEQSTILSPFEGLTIETEVVEMSRELFDLHPISAFNFDPREIEFPQGTMSSLVGQTTEEFKYQRIERQDVFGHLGKSFGVQGHVQATPVLSKIRFRQK